MADLAIQKSQHLLKTLNEQIAFLSSLMSETEDLVSKMNRLTVQVTFASSVLKNTWSSLEKEHQNWDTEKKEEEPL